MKPKLTLISLLLVVCTALSLSATPTGSWLMTKAETDGAIEKPFFITTFLENGNFEVMGMEFGSWTYDEGNQLLVLESDADEDFCGEGQVISLTDRELIVVKNGTKMSYIKIDPDKTAENNRESGLTGMWKIEDKPFSGTNTILTFSEPDTFQMIQKGDGVTSNFSGTWLFETSSRNLIMIGLRGEDLLHGESRILEMGEDTVELDNEGMLIHAERMAQNTDPIERLHFSWDEFYTEDGDYKYEEEEQKLPWLDYYEKMNSLADTHCLVYEFSTLINDTNSFENQRLTAYVECYPEEESLSIDNIFAGFDIDNLPEDAELPFGSDPSNPLYPLNDDTYRVVGEEAIATPAGTFTCVVVEAVGFSYQTVY
jgi:hypothetical protein